DDPVTRRSGAPRTRSAAGGRHCAGRGDMEPVEGAGGTAGSGGAAMTRPTIAVLAWLPDGVFEQLHRDHADFDWRDARTPDALNKHLAEATITYGLPPIDRLAEAPALRWVQLISAGVPPELCVAARQRGITVTNLAGLYGPSIAEHALGLLIL